MPYRKTIFIQKGIYHIYNRGVEKRIIFSDNQDYETFLDILTYYLTFITKTPLNTLTRTGLVNTGIFQKDIKLLTFCLMPNHFHLLLQQKEKDSITKFIRRILTTYAMYFNKRNNRIGSLFQGRFKAKLIDTDPYLLQSSKYIHRNPLDINTRTGLVEYPWSSYCVYVKKQKSQKHNHKIFQLISTQTILNYFSDTNSKLSYSYFVEESPLENWYQKDLKWTQ